MVQYVLNGGHTSYTSTNHVNSNCGINPVLTNVGMDGYLTSYEIKTSPSSSYNGATNGVSYSGTNESEGTNVGVGLNRFAPRNKHQKDAHFLNLETTSSNKIRSAKVVGATESTGTIGYNLSTGHYQYTDVGGVQRIVKDRDSNVGFSDAQVSGSIHSKIDLTTRDYFVIINVDEPKNHHIAKITKIVSFDYTGDGFEFSPSYGSNVSKGAKFAIYAGPETTNTDVVAVGYGLNDILSDSDQRNSEWVQASSPSFYFYSERLKNKNALDYSTKYQLNTSRWLGSVATGHYAQSVTATSATNLRIILNVASQTQWIVGDKIQNEEGVVFGSVGALGATGEFVHLDVTIVSGLNTACYPQQYSQLYEPYSAVHEKTVFMTKAENSPTKYDSSLVDDTFVSNATVKDLSPFNMHSKVYDELENLDKAYNPANTKEANKGGLGTDTTYTTNWASWTDCFRNYASSNNGKVLGSGGDGEGNKRYLHNKFSPDSSRFLSNIIDYEITQEYTNTGNTATVSLLDNNDLSKTKIKQGETLEIRNTIYNGKINSKFDCLLEGEVSAFDGLLGQITVDTLDVNYDYNVVLGKDPYEQVKIGEYVFQLTNISQSVSSNIKTAVLTYGGWRSATQKLSEQENGAFSYGWDENSALDITLTGEKLYRTAWSSVCGNLILKNEKEFSSRINYSITDAPYLGGEQAASSSYGSMPLPVGSYNRGSFVSTKEDDTYSESHLVLGEGNLSQKRFKIKFSDSKYKCVYLEGVKELTPDVKLKGFNHIIQGFLKHDYQVINGVTKTYTPTILDFYEGEFLIERDIFKGKMQNIDTTESNIPITKIWSIDKSSEILNVKINKNLEFTSDYVYSTNSPVKSITPTQYKFCGKDTGTWVSHGQTLGSPSGWTGTLFLINAETSPTLFKFDVGQHLFKPDGTWIGEITEVKEPTSAGGKFWAIKIGRGTQCIITTNDWTRHHGDSKYTAYFGMVNGVTVINESGINMTDWCVSVNTDYQSTTTTSGFTAYDSSSKPTGNDIILGNALSANPFENKRLDALTSCADKGVVFSNGKELITTTTTNTANLGPSSSIETITTVSNYPTVADLHSTSSDEDLESLGYYINNPISVSNSKDLEFMFKLTQEEVSSTFANIQYKNKRTVSSMSQYGILSVESSKDKRGIIKIAPICPLILARVDLNAQDTRLMDEIPLWRKETSFGGADDYNVGDIVERSVDMGSRFGGYIRLKNPLHDNDLQINDLVFDSNDNYLGMINKNFTNYEFETIDFDTNVTTLINNRIQQEQLKKIKKTDFVQHGLYFLNTQGMPDGGFIQMLDEIKDPLEAPRMYNPPIPNRPEVAKDNSGNYITGSNLGYLVGQLDTRYTDGTTSSDYPYGFVNPSARLMYGETVGLSTGDWSVIPNTHWGTTFSKGTKDMWIRIDRTNSAITGNVKDYLSIGDSIFRVRQATTYYHSDIEYIGIIKNILTDYDAEASSGAGAVSTGRDSIQIHTFNLDFNTTALSNPVYLLGQTFNAVGTLGSNNSRYNMIVTRGGNPSEFFSKGDVICREDSKILGTYLSCTDIDKGPSAGEYVITIIPVRTDSVPTRLSHGERLYKFDDHRHFVNDSSSQLGLTYLTQANKFRNNGIWGGYVQSADTSSQKIMSFYHKGAIEFFGPTLFRYVDLQKGGYGSFNRLNKNKSYFSKTEKAYNEPSAINAYATAFKVRQGYTDEPTLIPYGYNIQNERSDWLVNPENKEGPIMGSNITTFAKGNFIDSGYSSPKSHVYEQSEIVDSGGLYSGSSFSTYSAWGDALEEIDTKALHWQIFSISDLYPESIYHSNHIGYVNATHEFNEFSIVLKGKSGSSSSNTSHQKYSGVGASKIITNDVIETLDIESASINPRQMRRFGLLRLIEVTTDYLFNNVDGENVKKGMSKTIPSFENNLQIPYLHLPILGTTKQIPTNNYHYGGQNSQITGQGIKQSNVKTTNSGSIYSIDGNRPYIALDSSYPNLDFSSMSSTMFNLSPVSSWRQQIFRRPNQIIANEQGWILGRYYLGGMYVKGRYENTGKHSSDITNIHREVGAGSQLNETGLFTSINYLPLDVGFHVDEHTRISGSTALPQAATYTLIDYGYLVRPTNTGRTVNGDLDYTTSLEGEEYMLADSTDVIALIGQNLDFTSNANALGGYVTSVTFHDGTTTLSAGDLLGCLDPDGVKKFLGEVEQMWADTDSVNTEDHLYIKLTAPNRVPYNYKTRPSSPFHAGAYSGTSGAMANTQQNVPNSPLYKITVNAPDIEGQKTLHTGVTYTMPVTRNYSVKLNDNTIQGSHTGGGGDINGYQTFCQIRGLSGGSAAANTTNLHGKIHPLGAFKNTQVNTFALKPHMMVCNSKGQMIGELVYTAKFDTGLVVKTTGDGSSDVIEVEDNASDIANMFNGIQIWDDTGKHLGGISASSASVGSMSITMNGNNHSLVAGQKLYNNPPGSSFDTWHWIIKFGTGWHSGVTRTGTNRVDLTNGEFLYLQDRDNAEHNERFVWSYMLTKKSLNSNTPQYNSAIKGRDSLPLLEHFVVGQMGSMTLIKNASNPVVASDFRPSKGLLGTQDQMYLGLDTTNNAGQRGDGTDNDVDFLHKEGGGLTNTDQKWLATGIGSWITTNYRRGSYDWLSGASATTLDVSGEDTIIYSKHNDMGNIIPYGGVTNSGGSLASVSNEGFPNISHVTHGGPSSITNATSSNNAKRKYRRFVEHVKTRGAYVITPICFSCDFQRYGAINVSPHASTGGLNFTSGVISDSLSGYANNDEPQANMLQAPNDHEDGDAVLPASLTHYRRSAFQNKCDDPFSPSFMWGGVGGDGIDREGNLIIEDTNITKSRDSSPAYQLRQPSRVLMRLTEGNLLTALNYKTDIVSNMGEAHIGVHLENDPNIFLTHSEAVFKDANPHKNTHEPFLYSSAIPVIVDSGKYSAINSESSNIEKGMTIPKGGYYDSMFGGASLTGNTIPAKTLTSNESNNWAFDGSASNIENSINLGSPTWRRLYTQPYLFGNRSETSTTTNVITHGLIPIVNYDSYDANLVATTNRIYDSNFPTNIEGRGYNSGNRMSANQNSHIVANVQGPDLNQKGSRLVFLNVNMFTSIVDNYQLDYGVDSTKSAFINDDDTYTKIGLRYFNWNKGTFNYGNGTSSIDFRNHPSAAKRHWLPLDPNADVDKASISTKLTGTTADIEGYGQLPYTMMYYQHHYGNSIGLLGWSATGSFKHTEGDAGHILNSYLDSIIKTTEPSRRPHVDLMGTVYNTVGNFERDLGTDFNYSKSSPDITVSDDASQFNKLGTLSRTWYGKDISGTSKGASYNYTNSSILYKWRIHLFSDKSHRWNDKLLHDSVLPKIDTDTVAWNKDGAREESILSPRNNNNYQVVRFYTTDWNNLASSNGGGFAEDEQRRVAGFLNLFPDLTGYYLVSEEGVSNSFDGLVRNTPYMSGNYGFLKKRQNPLESYTHHNLEEDLYTDIEDSNPNYIHKIHYHEVHLDRDLSGGFETGKRYIHTLVIDNYHNSYFNNVFNYIGNYRIMRPAETCIHKNSPTKLPLYTMSKTTTKKSGSSEMYDLNIREYHKMKGQENQGQNPTNEGIFSMYLPVITDGPAKRSANVTIGGLTITCSSSDIVDDGSEVFAGRYISAPQNTMIEFIPVNALATESATIVTTGVDTILSKNYSAGTTIINPYGTGASIYGQRVDRILQITVREGITTHSTIATLINSKSASGFTASSSTPSEIFNSSIVRSMFTNGRENAFVTSRTPSDLFEEEDIIDRAWTNNKSYDVLMTDGVNKLNSNITVNYKNTRINSAKESEFSCSLDVDIKQLQRMVGIVSIGEAFTITTSLSPSIKGVESASIGSSLSVGEESLDSVKNLLKAENIDFIVPSESPNTYFSLSTFKNKPLTLAIDGLLQNKNMKMVVNNDTVSLRNIIEDRDKTALIIDSRSVEKMGIMVSAKKESLFSKYNEVIVQGLSHRTKKINGDSIRKYGRITLQEFDQTLTTKGEVIKRANTLLELHSKEQERIFVTMGIKSSKTLNVGNLIKVNLPKQGVVNDEYRIMKMVYNSGETVSLELGTSDVSLAQMVAHSLVAKDSMVGNVLPQTKESDSEPLDIFEQVRVKEIRLLIKKHSYKFPNTGVLINNVSNYASGSTDTVTVDGVDATTKFSDGDMVYTSNNVFIGEIEDITSATTIIFTQPIATSLVDNEQLWNGGAVATIGFNTPIGYHTPIGFQATASPIHTEEILLDLDLTKSSEVIT